MTLSESAESSPWFDGAMLALTVCIVALQCYVFALIRFASPPEIADYRRYLGAAAMLEALLTLAIGVGICPVDLMTAHCIGARIRGLFTLFGADGARIGIGVCAFLFVLLLGVQQYSLVYRWALIEHSRFPLLTHKLLGWRVITAQFLYSTLWAAIVVFGANSVFMTPNEVVSFLDNPTSKCTWAMFPNFLPGGSSAFLLMEKVETIYQQPLSVIFQIALIVGFIMFELLIITFSRFIMQKLRKNAHVFSAKTYRMHRQMTVILLVQIFLPLLFLIVPIMVTMVLLFMQRFVSPGVLGFPMPQGPIEAGILFLQLLPLGNALLTVGFVSPYRRRTVELALMLHRRFFKRPCPEQQQLQQMTTTNNDVVRSITDNNNIIIGSGGSGSSCPKQHQQHMQNISRSGVNNIGTTHHRIQMR